MTILRVIENEIFFFSECVVTQSRFRRQRTSDCAALTFQRQVSLSQFVLASPTAKRRTIEPLASVLKEGFRKRGEREILEREILERVVI